MILKEKILCFQKLHFKILELQNCIWGARIQDPVSFPALHLPPDNPVIYEMVMRNMRRICHTWSLDPETETGRKSREREKSIFSYTI